MSSHFHYFQDRITKKAPAKSFELYWKETHESLMFISFRILIFFGAKYPNLSNTLCIVYEFLTGYHASDTYRHIKTGNWEHLNNEMSLFFIAQHKMTFANSTAMKIVLKLPTQLHLPVDSSQRRYCIKWRVKKLNQRCTQNPVKTSKAELFTKMVNG